MLKFHIMDTNGKALCKTTEYRHQLVDPNNPKGVMRPAVCDKCAEFYDKNHPDVGEHV